MIKDFPSKIILKIGILLVLLVMASIVYVVVEFIFVKQPLFSVSAILYLLFSLGFACAISLLMKAKRLLFLLFLIVVSFTSVVLIILWANTAPISDFLHLNHLAVMLKNGDIESLQSDAYFMRWAYQTIFIAYQAFIMTIFPFGITPLLVMNALYMTLAVVFIYLISCELYNQKVAIWVTALYLLYPAPYFLASVLTNQHISLAFILAGILVFIRNNEYTGKRCYIHYAGSGALIAAGNAFRPDALVIAATFCAIIAIIGFMFWKNGFRCLVRTTAPYLLTICSFVFLTTIISALVMLSGINPNGQKNSDPLWKLVVGLDHKTLGNYSNSVADQVFSIADDDERHSAQRQIIKEHLSLDAKTLLAFFLDKNTKTWESYEAVGWAFMGQDERIVPVIQRTLGRTLQILKEAERLYFLLISLFVCISLVILLRRPKIHVFFIICGLTIFFFFGIYTLIEAQSRYRYFIIPFIFILSGVGFDSLLCNEIPKKLKTYLMQKRNT